LKNSGLRIAAISEKSEKTIWETDLSGPIALMLGSEEDGISPAYLQKTDIHLRIPMPKPIDSLNVSVAAGIACFEVVRQRIKA
jgi:23S rRNA (guanosine2251-2'-O)-methyltransferase